MMQGRVLICIGCNTHASDAIPDLGAAEQDAENIFSTLSDSSVGDYESERSALLLSPTLDEVRTQLGSMARSQSEIGTLTFFFAGHGAIHQGSLYLFMRDTEANALSVSAFSLSDLIRIVADQQIPHVNIILDACQAGGLWSELGPLLNSESVGARNTPSLSLLAMAASDEFAEEDGEGGYGTQALLACITGKTVCNTEFPTLDLMEIGREISKAFEAAAQIPVRWGLNLTGASTFCYNPCFEGQNADVTDLQPYFDVTAAGDAAAPFKTDIWTTYLNLETRWNARGFYDLLDSMLADNDGDGLAQAGFVESMALSFAEQAKRNADSSVVSEVLAVCALVLLKRGAPGSEVDTTCERLLRQSLDWAAQRLSDLADELQSDQNALLSRKGGPFDFYYLPIRISKILGWAGASALCSESDTKDGSYELVNRLLDGVLDKYANNLIVMNDAQAGPLALIGAALSKSGDMERLEALLSYYLHSLSQQAGLVASNTISPDRIFEYLVARYQPALKAGSELVSQPSELVAVCIRLCTLAELADVMDDMMSDLDHIWLNAYVPDHYRAIGDDRLENGSNITIRIGHDIWRVKEFEDAWPNELIHQPASPAEHMGALLASLIFGDRVCWFEIEPS